MLKHISIISFAVCISSCAGLAVGTYGKKESAQTDFSLSRERNTFAFTKHTELYSATEIVSLWGEPDEKEKHKDCEVLIYKDGISWAGVGAFVGIVPVPLVVPTGKYRNRFYIKNGVSVGLVQEYGEVGRSAGYVCGSNSCDGSAGEKVNEPKLNAKKAIKEWCK